jgi:uncharacterized protein
MEPGADDPSHPAPPVAGLPQDATIVPSAPHENVDVAPADQASLSRGDGRSGRPGISQHESAVSALRRPRAGWRHVNPIACAVAGACAALLVGSRILVTDTAPAPPPIDSPAPHAVEKLPPAPPDGVAEAPSAPAEAAPAEAPPETVPAWRRFAVTAPPADGKPTISLMIDDMGLNRPQSDRAVNLPGPLTLSWMSYARNVTAQAAIGRAHGHETMLHMPFEPLGHVNPGPDALRTWMSPEANLANFRHALDLLPNAVGMNQHEGSVGSLSVPLMDLVAGELRARGLLFIDSLTIKNSVALARARAAGIPTMPRDVFLDNSPDPAAIRAQIAEMEGIARRTGHVIAIGHPRQTTMDVLTQYLASVKARGFVLWPVSATVAAESHVVVVRQ